MKFIACFILFVLSTATICAAEPQAQHPVGVVPDWQQTVQLNQQQLGIIQDDLSQQRQFAQQIDASLQSTTATLSGDIATLQADAQLASGKIAVIDASVQKIAQQVLSLANTVKRQERLISSQGDDIVANNELVQGQTTALQGVLQQKSEQIDTLAKSLAANKAEFAMRISQVNSGVDAAQKGLTTLDRNMGNKVNRLNCWLVLVALIGGIGVAIGIMLRKKLSNSSNQLEKNIAQVRLKMEEENVQLDTKLVEVLQGQMKLAQEQQLAASSLVNAEVDHTLQLKVGEEIFRMRLRLGTLPKDTKGLKPLLKSLERLEDEFNHKGYELIDLLGKPFNDGLNANIRFLPSDELKAGERIISKIMKPQINFNDTVIQIADIEVMTGE